MLIGTALIEGAHDVPSVSYPSPEVSFAALATPLHIAPAEVERASSTFLELDIGVHNQWLPYTQQMAKCDFCDKRKRGALQKCRQCMTTICLECVSNGKLLKSNRHKIASPNDLDWTMPHSRRQRRAPKRNKAAAGRERTASAAQDHGALALITKTGTSTLDARPGLPFEPVMTPVHIKLRLTEDAVPDLGSDHSVADGLAIPCDGYPSPENEQDHCRYFHERATELLSAASPEYISANACIDSMGGTGVPGSSRKRRGKAPAEAIALGCHSTAAQVAEEMPSSTRTPPQGGVEKISKEDPEVIGAAMILMEMRQG